LQFGADPSIHERFYCQIVRLVTYNSQHYKSQRHTHLKMAGNLLTKAFAALFTCSTSGSRPCTHCQNTFRVKSALTTTAGTSQPLWRILLWVRKASPCTGLPASQLALAFRLDAVEVWVVLLYMTGGCKASEGSTGVLASLLRVESGEAFWPGCGVGGPSVGPAGESACWALIGGPRALSNASCIDKWQMHHLLHVNFHMQAYVMTIPQDTVRGGCNTAY